VGNNFWERVGRENKLGDLTVAVLNLTTKKLRKGTDVSGNGTMEIGKKGRRKRGKRKTKEKV